MSNNYYGGAFVVRAPYLCRPAAARNLGNLCRNNRQTTSIDWFSERQSSYVPCIISSPTRRSVPDRDMIYQIDALIARQFCYGLPMMRIAKSPRRSSNDCERKIAMASRTCSHEFLIFSRQHFFVTASSLITASQAWTEVQRRACSSMWER